MMFIRTDVSLENGDVPIFSHTVQCAHNRDRIGHGSVRALERTDATGVRGQSRVKTTS